MKICIYALNENYFEIQLGITDLPDNKKSNEYTYEIIVFTGHRRNASTESKVCSNIYIINDIIKYTLKVHFLISGENNHTDVRTFSNLHRKIFQSGGIDAFIMTTPK